MDILRLAVEVLYLFAPLLVSAAVAGAVLRHNLFAGLRGPIDGGLSLGGKRLFGDHKTWRVVLVTVASSVATVGLQKITGGWARPIALVDYGHLNAVAFGTAMGGGAMLGELPNSFCKRRIGVPPGGVAAGPTAALFYVWDQVDLLTGVWPLLGLWLRPSGAMGHRQHRMGPRPSPVDRARGLSPRCPPDGALTARPCRGWHRVRSEFASTLVALRSRHDRWLNICSSVPPMHPHLPSVATLEGCDDRRLDAEVELARLRSQAAIVRAFADHVEHLTQLGNDTGLAVHVAGEIRSWGFDCSKQVEHSKRQSIGTLPAAT